MPYQIKILEGHASSSDSNGARVSEYRINSPVTRVGTDPACDLIIEESEIDDYLLFQLEYQKLNGRTSLKILPKVHDALKLDGRKLNVDDVTPWRSGSRVLIYDKVLLELEHVSADRAKTTKIRDKKKIREAVNFDFSQSQEERTGESFTADYEDERNKFFSQPNSEEPEQPETVEAVPKQTKNQTTSNSKQLLELIVTVVCLSIAALFAYNAFVKKPSANTAQQTFGKTQARDFYNKYAKDNKQELLARFDAALWAEQFNKAQARYQFKKLRYETRKTFNDKLQSMSSDEKQDLYRLYDYLELKINPPKNNED